MRTALGLLLLVAAALKTHQLATEPVPGEGLLSSRGFQIVWVEGEILLGLWLVSGLARRAAWAAALACFVVFVGVTLPKALTGADSCGCFGAVKVNPWYTLVLDVGAVGALTTFRPNLKSRLQPPPRVRLQPVAAVLISLATGAAAAIPILRYEPAMLSLEGTVVGGGRPVLLEPKEWIGKPCPLLAHIDIGSRLAKGQWIVVLYHHDCPHCQERVPQFEQEARERAERMNIARTAMVELAPYAPPGRSLLPAGTPCVLGRASDERDWFVATPTLLALIEGTVVEAVVGEGRPGPAEAGLAVWGGAAGQKPVAVEDGEYAFGFVEPGSIRKVVLAIRNPSAKALTIRRVQSECLCMAAETPREPILPGQTASVRLVFVAPRKGLHYDKRILLHTDDPEHALIPIRIQAEVGLAMEVRPSPVDFGELALGEEREGTVTIRNRAARPVRLIYSTSSASGCLVRVPREAVPPGGERAVPTVVRAQGRGPQSVTISIHTDLESQPSFAIPVRFDVVERPRVGGLPSAAASVQLLEPEG
ncbi:MAG: DUF1573 domain-containing protein [Planctomycetota bacterium]|nr:DUF1573 domain-containing protein [Planctomycetota bacterium]